MRRYDPKKPIYSLHVPKAGGISLRDYLDNYFDVVLSHYNYTEDVDGIEVWKLPTRWKEDSLARLARKRRVCVHGHFRKSQSSFVSDYYPGAEQFMAILRDPLEMTISHYYYRKRLEASGVKRMPKSLDTFVTEHENQWEDHLPAGFVEDTANAMKQFVAIGTLERIDLFLDQLAQVTGRVPSEPFPHANSSPRGKPPSEASVAAWMDRNWPVVKAYDTIRTIAEGGVFVSRARIRFNGTLERFMANFRPYSASR